MLQKQKDIDDSVLYILNFFVGAKMQQWNVIPPQTRLQYTGTAWIPTCVGMILMW